MRNHNMLSFFALVCRTQNYPICIYIIYKNGKKVNFYFICNWFGYILSHYFNL